MKFKNPKNKNLELTFNDVFIFQNNSNISSRFEVDVKPYNKLNSNLPIITANMNAISGKRMCETIARFGWLWCLPQDMSLETITKIIKNIKSADIIYDTPITIKEKNTIRDALGLIKKRSHNCVILINNKNKPIWIFNSNDFKWYDQYTYLWEIKNKKLISAKIPISAEKSFEIMEKNGISSLPIVDKNWILKWIMTKSNAIRNWIYKPSLDKNWKLDVCVALWINNFLERAKKLYKLWITKFVLDTAHWYQEKMIKAIKIMRKEFWKNIVLIAGNISTKEAVKDLIKAWADWVKVGIWPWAMCTTRIKTWVWRPQFTAIYECSLEAKKLWGFVWADWWIRNPRDLALSLAAWASHIMMWTILTWTYESTWDFLEDAEWKLYKQNYWMASLKAVYGRNKDLSSFEIAKKTLYQEWISNSKIYQKLGRESVWKIIDEFIMWLKSSMSYVWARNIEDFYEKAIIWVQTTAWFIEWTPHWKIIK